MLRPSTLPATTLTLLLEWLRPLLRQSNTWWHNPAMGRPGRVSGTRELVVPDTPYIVPYRVRRNAVEVLRVFHAAGKWPSGF
jgi:plasmid stabilization system protein ParE